MTSPPLRVLVVDDDEEDWFLTSDVFHDIEGGRYELTWAASYEDGLARIQTAEHDVCLLDYRLGAQTGLDLLRAALETGCEAPMILLTGQGDREVDLEAMRSGAADFLNKGHLEPDLLERTIRYAIERKGSERRLKEMAEALRVERDRANKATEAKSHFLAAMSHEIRTPMNGVIGLTNVLADTELDAEQQELLATIRHSGQSLVAIINDILDFSKIEARRLDLDEQPTPVRQLVFDVAELLLHKAEEKGIALTVLVADDVPAVVVADPVRWRQILTNLVGNAIKFTQAGGVCIRVRAVETADGIGGVQLSVEDTGIGIPPEQAARLFEPFVQAEAGTARRFGGTGLGLAICRCLAEMMHGRVWLESEEGRGSTFHVILRAPVADAAGAAPAALGHDRVCLWEPDRRVRMALRHAFWALGARVDIAKDLDACRQAAQRGHPIYLRLTPESEALHAELVREHAAGGPPVVLLCSPATRSEASARVAGTDLALVCDPIRPAALCAAVQGPGTDGAGRPLSSATRLRQRLPEDLGLRRVLLVEDNLVNQKVASKTLERLGVAVDVAGDGQAGVDAVQATAYDVVLMDVQMPIMDGYEATRAIRALPGDVARIPIIAMTASAMRGDRDACLAAGMDDFVPKPFSVDELVRALADTHASRRAA